MTQSNDLKLEDLYFGSKIAPVNVTRVASDVSQSRFDATYIVYGGAIIAGLIIISIVLYLVDSWATARLDQFLFDYYGPSQYEYLTNNYNPDLTNQLYTSPAESQEPLNDLTWTREDTIAALLLNSPSHSSLQSFNGVGGGLASPNQLSFSSLAGYRSLSHKPAWQQILEALTQLHDRWESA